MRIAQSDVNLVSTNHYYEENTVSISSGVVAKGSFMESLQNQEKDSLELSEDSVGTSLGSENYNNLKSYKSGYLSTYEMSLQEQIAQIRASLLESLLSFLQLIGGDRSRSGYQETIGEASSMITESHFVKVTTVQMSHVEEEATSFTGQGKALTEDGREIDFNVSFSMSRRLSVYAGVSLASAVSMIDPLVINVGSDVTNISDQSFYFDLDCDGEDEKIAGLGAGTGFLTYDRNGDGKINDGSELFGTKSGDGFRDLAQYDEDGNGWIDEGDSIYGKLRVWLRGEDGVDTLLSLQEADVGAIFLGSAQTEYTFGGKKSDDNGFVPEIAAAAMMRASGLFLRESGGVGTVHQMDLARL
ncbi:hypothetical protein [Butyrivibrio sp. VCB2006]|uniref:hypothetical protein n=1 Tax=Butyrivibrio sp. VCB2006 TaxID=1280679 RepID=UPI0012DE52A0|nr:hypothetical protein [Butyrivibrio sp. VCB2006]